MTKTKLKTRTVVPVGDRVTVREIPMEERTASGIVLPPSARNMRSRTGVVLLLGDGVTSKAFKPGDTVLISEYAGMELSIDGEKQLLLATGEVVAVLREG
jgi:chaperonin GroES